MRNHFFNFQNLTRRTYPNPSRTLRGFTLIEMVVVVAIVGILAAAAIPLAAMGEQRLKERELRHALRDIRQAIDGYRKASDSGYPPSLAVLVEGVPDTRSPTKAQIYFLRRIPADPFGEPGGRSNGGWGLRSYASPPDEPKPGDDVFDVYSLSEGIGSNGIAYRNW